MNNEQPSPAMYNYRSGEVVFLAFLSLVFFSGSVSFLSVNFEDSHWEFTAGLTVTVFLSLYSTARYTGAYLFEELTITEEYVIHRTWHRVYRRYPLANFQYSSYVPFGPRPYWISFAGQPFLIIFEGIKSARSNELIGSRSISSVITGLAKARKRAG